jgi:hypothetical protein
MGFTKSEAYLNLYFILVGLDPLILVLCLDYLFLTSEYDFIAGCKVDLSSEFKMKYISLMNYLLVL